MVTMKPFYGYMIVACKIFAAVDAGIDFGLDPRVLGGYIQTTKILAHQNEVKDEMGQMMTNKMEQMKDAIIEALDAKMQICSNYQDITLTLEQERQQHEENLDEQNEQCQDEKDRQKQHYDNAIQALKEQNEYLVERLDEQENINEELNRTLEEERQQHEQALEEQKQDLGRKIQEQNKVFESQKQRYENILQELNEQNKALFAKVWTKTLDSKLWIWISDESVYFEDAVQSCQEMNARLYEPKNLSQNQMVHSLAKSKADAHFWIGINNHRQHGQ